MAALAREAGPNGKLPTVQELYRQLGTSPITLDRALSVVERRGLIRRRRSVGIFASATVNSRTIGVVFGQDLFRSCQSPYWNLLLRRIEQTELQRENRCRVYVEHPRRGAGGFHDEPVYGDLKAGALDGVLVANVFRFYDIEEMRSFAVPVVHHAVGPGGPGAVNLDYAEMIRLGVRALAERGCRRIGLIAPEAVATDAAPGVFARAVAEAGLPYLPEWRWEHPMYDPIEADAVRVAPEELGVRAINAWLERGSGPPAGRLPDGILMADDMMARGALVALSRAGVAIGRDVHVASQANKGSPALAGFEDCVTRIEFDPTEVARAMVELLERTPEGGNPPPEGVTIEPRVVECG